MEIKKTILKIFRTSINPFLNMGIGKFYLVKNGYKLVRKVFSPIKIRGYKMFLDPDDSLGLFIDPSYKASWTKFFEKEIKKGDTVLDMGAHIGYHTLIFADLVGETGRVFAFEPDPIFFSLLEKNVVVNGYKNVTSVQKAVSNKSGTSRMYLNRARADNRIYDSYDERQSIKIKTIKIDEYFKNYEGKIDFIKLWIQGAEGGAISGMLNLLEKNKGVKIITKFWPAGLKRFGTQPVEYLNELIKCGFKLNHLDEQTGKISPVSMELLMKICEKDEHPSVICE